MNSQNNTYMAKNYYGDGVLLCATVATRKVSMSVIIIILNLCMYFVCMLKRSFLE